jgi:hypothetical protein
VSEQGLSMNVLRNFDLKLKERRYFHSRLNLSENNACFKKVKENSAFDFLFILKEVFLNFSNVLPF